MSWGGPRPIFEHYFDEMIFFLKVGGLWVPPDNTPLKTRMLYFIYNGIWIVCQYVLVVPAELNLVVGSGSLTDAIRASRDFGNHFTAFVKFLNWHIWRKDLVMLVDKMQNVSLDYENCGIFRPKEMAAFHQKHTVKWAKTFMCIISMVLICMFVSYAIFIFFELELVIKPTLPMSFIFPVRNDTKTYHAASALFIYAPFALLGYTVLCLDCLFVVTTSCLSAHFLVLAGAMRTIQPRALEIAGNLEQHNLHSTMSKELRKCILHLEFIYRNFATMEAVFSYQVGFQMLMSWTQICFSLYLASLGDLFTGIGDLIYLSADLMELFIYCYFGDKVTQANEEVRKALYDSNWEATDQEFKRAVQISMMRLHRPVHITVSKLLPLNLQYFLTILRGGYSLFALIQRRSN